MEQHFVRETLTARHENLRDRLARVSVDGRHAGKLDPDFEEQAVERENDEVLGNLDDAIRVEMAEIEKALSRLDGGKYGICEACGKAIAPKRLDALPYATRCVAC